MILNTIAMKKINIFTAFLLIGSLACDKHDDAVPDKEAVSISIAESKAPISNEYAKVDQIQGLLIFIESTPVTEYQSLGKITNEGYVEKVESDNGSTTKKR